MTDILLVAILVVLLTDLLAGPLHRWYSGSRLLAFVRRNLKVGAYRLKRRLKK